MASSWVNCPSGGFTRIYASPSPFGFVYVWAQNPPANVQYQIYNSSPPFYLSGTMTVQAQSTLFVGPTLYVEIWINPQVAGTFRVT